MSDLSGEDLPSHQYTMVEILGDFEDHDALGLRSLTPAGRAEQLAARNALHGYLTDLWENAKQVGHRPADHPDFAALAALRDLADALRSAAAAAQTDAND
jgi:hypothetical protein